MSANETPAHSLGGDSVNLQEYVALMTKHQGNLRAFVISLIPGSAEVDDVLQETNAVLWQKRERFQSGSNFLAWAFQIARYEVHRSRDRAKRMNKIIFSDDLVALLAEEENASNSHGDRTIAALDCCLEKLSKNQREIVRHRYTPGLNLEHLAEHSGRSAGSLRVALLRIREALKHCIEQTLANPQP